MTTFLTIIFILVAILLVLIVLVQRGRGGGLSGAFGSGGGSTSAFGTKTGDVFTWVTVVLFVVFMLMAIWLNYRFQNYTPVLKSTVATAPAAVVSATAPASLDPDAPKLPETPRPAAPAAAPSTTQPK